MLHPRPLPAGRRWTTPRPLPPPPHASVAVGRRHRRHPAPAPARLPPSRALTPDASPTWTLDQIAGLVFGAGLLASFLLASRVDAAIARGQRAELGLCMKCGGVNEVGTCPEAECPLRGRSGGGGGGS